MTTPNIPDPLQAGQRWQHIKRGTCYEIIGAAELQNANTPGLREGAILTIYRGDDGKLWARDQREFTDGRFVLAALEATPSLHPEGEGAVSASVYEAAVKGRQDFRNAYRALLPVERAAAALCLLWRTPGESMHGDRFINAVAALDEALCGNHKNSVSRPILEAKAALTPSTVTEGTVPDDGGAPDESSITDAQIADALRHGFGDEAVPADPSREVLTAFAASLDAVPFDTASAAFFSFDTTHGHARVLRRAIRELIDRVETARPPYQPFWENPDGPQAA